MTAKQTTTQHTTTSVETVRDELAMMTEYREATYRGSLMALRDKADWLRRDMTNLMRRIDDLTSGNVPIDRPLINELGEAQIAAELNRMCSVVHADYAAWREARFIAERVAAAITLDNEADALNDDTI